MVSILSEKIPLNFDGALILSKGTAIYRNPSHSHVFFYWGDVDPSILREIFGESTRFQVRLQNHTLPIAPTPSSLN